MKKRLMVTLLAAGVFSMSGANAMDMMMSRTTSMAMEMAKATDKELSEAVGDVGSDDITYQMDTRDLVRFPQVIMDASSLSNQIIPTISPDMRLFVDVNSMIFTNIVAPNLTR